jgi:hypothetical protein
MKLFWRQVTVEKAKFGMPQPESLLSQFRCCAVLNLLFEDEPCQVVVKPKRRAK